MSDETEKPNEPTGRAKGGIARKMALTPERRREIATKAAVARYGSRPLRALKKGNFKEKLGIDADCYVLDDTLKTPVISQTGMAKVLGLSSRGNAFPRFMASNAMVAAAGADLTEKLGKVLVFQWGSAGAGQPSPQQPSTPIYGHDAALLIDVCRAILSAKLKPNQAKVVEQASIILGASAKQGIRDLVYALAGYSQTAEEVIKAFQLYVKQEAKKYEQEFPPELYAAWHRLYEIPVPVRGKPWLFAQLTLRHIYIPLAKSEGKILELLRDSKAKDDDRRRKLFQFLSDVGTRALRLHIGRLTEMAESSKLKLEYESKVTERFGGHLQYELPLAIPTEPSPSEAPVPEPTA